MNLLLDTHTLIWFLNGNETDLSAKAKWLIADSAKKSEDSINDSNLIICELLFSELTDNEIAASSIVNEWFTIATSNDCCAKWLNGRYGLLFTDKPPGQFRIDIMSWIHQVSYFIVNTLAGTSALASAVFFACEVLVFRSLMPFERVPEMCMSRSVLSA